MRRALSLEELKAATYGTYEDDPPAGLGHRAETARPERGHGFDAITVLTRARELAGDPRFGGCAMDAMRQAGRERDIDIHRACVLLKQRRPPERIAKRIADVPEVDRPAFRRRMLLDFDGAIAYLLDAAKPNLRRTVAVRAARDAQNWAGLSFEEKEERWAEVFARAMEDHDRDGRARGISGAERLVSAPRPTQNGTVRTFGPRTN